MSESTQIADELRRAFDNEAWHGDPLFKILQGITATQAAARPIRDAHSIWELLLHIAAWDGAVRRRMAGVSVKLNAARNFPPVTDTSDAAWQAALAHVRQTHDELIAAVEKFPAASWSKQVPGKTGKHYNFRYMLRGISQHVAYHAGQISLLKKFCA